MRAMLLLALVIAVFGFMVSPSRGDTEQPQVGEDFTDTPAPHTAAAKVPFVPYSAGPPEALWSYESLTSAEKRVADAAHSRDYTATLDGFAVAVRARSVEARAEGAAIQLGLGFPLAEIGIVP